MTHSLAALLALLVSAVLPPERPVPAPRRPIVLLVHGRGQVGDSVSLHHAATRALLEGAEAVSGHALLRDGDVRLVWYADLLSEQGVSTPECPAPQRARATGSPVSVDPGALDMFSLVAAAFLELAGEDTRDSPLASVRGLIGDVRFLTNPSARCAAEGRIANAIAVAAGEGRPVILVAHSLGGLMAWGHLQNRVHGMRSIPSVHRFVTLGSPVGSPEVRQFVFGSSGTLGLPAGVDSWVNVVDLDDPFATPLLPAIDADSTTTITTGPGLRDAMTESRRDDVHDLRGYLRDPAATHAILDAWCSAMRGDRDSASACATLLLTSPQAR